MENAARVNVIVRLLRAKRERDADIELQGEIEKDECLLQGFRHSKFGSFCLSSGDLDRAQEHLSKGQAILSQYYPCSNIWMNMGLVSAQRHNYEQATVRLKKAIEVSPHSQEQASPREVVYSKQLNSFSAYVDAHTNLAVMYTQMGLYVESLACCFKSLELKPQDNEAAVNYADVLRQLDRKEEAIEYSWREIERRVRKQKDKQYCRMEPICIQPYEFKEKEIVIGKITILTVKWGTRYNAEYVNKLYRGIRKNTNFLIEKFYCFTDDPVGLEQGITPLELETKWKKWWGKATLFNTKIEGRKFYIDLDMVITGNLDQLFMYQGDFALLKSGQLFCEKNHKNGYNSSIMIWTDNNIFLSVHKQLQENFETINKYIARFDFWLQMTIKNADYIQQIYPSKVIDFLKDAKGTLPQKSAVVCFARKPKPQDYPAEWIKDYWV